MRGLSSTFQSLTEAITTFIVICIATLISIIIFIHTIYKFFCESIPHDDRQNEADISPSPSSSPPSVGRRARSASSSPRSRMPSPFRGFTDSPRQHRHDKEIHTAIAALTMAYLLNASVYTFINWLLRLLMIFFEVSISCYALGYVQIAYVLVRISFYCLFTVRLKLTFTDSHLAVKSLYLTIICTLGSLLLIGAFIYFLFDVQRQYKAAGNDCSHNADINYIRALLPAMIVDTIVSVLLLYLFVSKLSQLIRVQTSSIDSLVSADQMTINRIKELILVSTRLTVLVCVYIIGYWLLFLLFLPILPGAATMLDISIGTFCVIFCYEFHIAHYNKYCFPCKWCCFHICFWWFILCKEESNAAKRFSVCDICCCLQSRSDNSKKDGTDKGQRKQDNTKKMTKDEVMLQAEMNNKDETLSTRDTNGSNMAQSARTKINEDVHNVNSEEMRGHEKNTTFAVSLNESKIAEQEEQDKEEEEEENITKSETDTFDVRAQRLRELQALFFDDALKTTERRKGRGNAANEDKRARSAFSLRRLEQEEKQEEDTDAYGGKRNKRRGNKLKLATNKRAAISISADFDAASYRF